MSLLEKLFGRDLTREEVDKLPVGSRIRVDGRVRTVKEQIGTPGYPSTQTVLDEKGFYATGQRAVTSVDSSCERGSRVRSTGLLH